MTEAANKKDNKKKDQKQEEDLVHLSSFRASKIENSKKKSMDIAKD